MEPGIYGGLTKADYFAIPAANKSGLDAIDQSPLHYWSRFLDPLREKKETPSLVLGTAIHCAVLEPERFGKEYRVKPEPEDFPDALDTVERYKEACRARNLRLAGNKEELKARLRAADTELRFFDDIEASFERFNLLTVKQWSACGRISASVRNCPAARTLFERGTPERVIIWRDEETGVLCKGMADWMVVVNETVENPVVEAILDLKSTTDASPRGFASSCAAYNYHRQAAWYVDGVMAATKQTSEPLFVFPVYETDEPFASAFYYASRDMISLGRVENRLLLRRYAECLKSGDWPGYARELVPINLPKWRTRVAEDQPQTPLETY